MIEARQLVSRIKKETKKGKKRLTSSIIAHSTGISIHSQGKFLLNNEIAVSGLIDGVGVVLLTVEMGFKDAVARGRWPVGEKDPSFFFLYS